MVDFSIQFNLLYLHIKAIDNNLRNTLYILLQQIQLLCITLDRYILI